MYELVVIGVSSGGIQALKTLLPDLPEKFPLPIAIVQHRDQQSDDFLANYLDTLSQLVVTEAEDKDPIQAGTIYLAPAGYHLMVEKERHFSLSVDPPVHFARPSIDTLFESAAEALGPALVGIILTGSNSDGAQGLKAIHNRGGLTLVQNPRTAESSPMPTAAQPHADYVLELTQIVPFLLKLVQGDARAHE